MSGYAKQRSNWLDFPTTSTPITAANLNGLETAIYDLKYLSYNVKDYGGVGDGVTSDTTAVTNTDANTGSKFLPAGTYLTTIAAGTLKGPFQGRGQIKDNAGHKRGPWFSAISAAPSSLGDWSSVVSAFDGDLSNVQIPIEHRVTGATTLGQPVATYVETPEAAPFVVYVYNESGWNQSTSSDSGGRTGLSMMYLRGYQAGLGDLTCLSLGAVAAGQKPGATSYAANSAAGLISGGVTAVAAGVNMNGVEFSLTDSGFDATGSGVVVQTNRTNDTGALGTVWNGYRIQNIGSKAIDVGFMINSTGGGNGAKVGLDLSSANFTSSGTWINAAVTLKADQRIYLNATGTDASSPSGIYRRPDGTGVAWIAYNSGDSSLRMAVGNADVLQIYSNLVASIQSISLATGKTYQVNNTQVVTARETGWTAMTGTLNKATSYDPSTITLVQLAQRVNSIQAAMTTHGLIGT